MLFRSGKMHSWHREDPSPTRTLIKLSYGGVRDIPKSIVVREKQRYGGVVVSWTVPVFILQSEQDDAMPGDESPEPQDGNPHPFMVLLLSLWMMLGFHQITMKQVRDGGFGMLVQQEKIM